MNLKAQRDISRKLRILKHAEETGNISKYRQALDTLPICSAYLRIRNFRFTTLSSSFVMADLQVINSYMNCPTAPDIFHPRGKTTGNCKFNS